MKDIKTVCIAGKNDIAVNIARCFLKEYPEYELLVLINKNDSGYNSWQLSLKKFATDNKIQIVSLKEIYHYKKLLFLSLEYDQIIIPSNFYSKYLFNIHFSCLPEYKGMYTSVWPILNGSSRSGVTLHKIDQGIDTGEIVEQECFDIDDKDTARDLYFKYLKYGTTMIKRNIPALITPSKLKTREQPSRKSSYNSLKSIDFNSIIIDINQTAFNIRNQIRAYNFREYQLPKVFDNEINEAKISNDRSLKKPGTVVYEKNNSICISTIDFNLILYKDKTKEFFYACESGDLKLFIKLIEYIPNIDIQNKQGWTPLIVSTYNNNKMIAEELLKRGADINKSNFKGTTPLMYAKDAAVNNNDTGIIDIMFNYGSDITQQDEKGLTIVDYCKNEKIHDILDYLEKLYQ